MTTNAHGAFRNWAEAEIDLAIRLHNPPHRLTFASIGARLGRTESAVKNMVYKARIAVMDADERRQRDHNRRADAKFILAGPTMR